MPVFAVIYRYTDEHERREGIRGEALLCAGPFGPDEEAGALLLFRASSKEEALAITADDPFRTHDLVSDVQVRHWMPALGELASRFPTT